MDEDNIIKTLNNSLKEIEDNFEKELHSLRAGRANVAMLNNVRVDVYGTSTPLNQVASIVVVDPKLLQVTPYDPNNLNAIVTSIRNNQELGLNPSDDGHLIRLVVPPLTEERRREIVKQIKQKMEENLVRIRNFRHDSMFKIDQNKKAKKIGEDEAKRYQKQINEAINNSKIKLELLTRQKEKEVISI
ncbi:MAG: ribosome recycling factor [Patescibacteria group bacterium]|jgi:ribosome recycling factor|nr:ribosome recycling factor [Patescibacteria group bacterium]